VPINGTQYIHHFNLTKEITMTNTSTREGRYTGLSLQAEPVLQAKAKAKLVIAVKPLAVKLNKKEQAILDLQAFGGIVAFGAWQTGTGNYKKSREIPDGAVVWSKIDTESYQYMPNTIIRPPKAPQHVCDWFAAHPRAKRCVALAV
jgi:hypothetical protein